MTTEQEIKEEKRRERIQRDADKFKEMLAVPRPGTSRSIEALSGEEAAVFKKKGLDLSDIVYVDPKILKPNPLNDYPPLAASELDELVADIKDKGVIVPLIVRLDDVVICGHNRLTAALKAALETVPAQRILGALTEALERDIMRSENDRRRGGSWSREEKEKFIRENFREELKEDNRGAHKKAKKFSELLEPGSSNLAHRIEKQSKGRIPEGTAKRLIAGIRKKQPEPVPKAGKHRLSPGQTKRREKLSARLVSVREVIALLEDKLTKARAEEKAVLKEMKAIGGPD